MLFDRVAVSANIRNKDGKRVFYLAKGDQLTSDARDYLTRERIEILPAEKARPERYQLLGGGYMEEKPEHMTHLNAQVLVPKTHPRIAYRGAMDTLEAALLLCQLYAPQWENELQEILEFARKLLRCDVLEEKVEEVKLCGMDQTQLRQRSHFPQNYYGQPHFMPEARDGQAVLWLNKARCAARDAELKAVAAMPEREDLLRAMNRLSSTLYILMIREKAKQL